MNDSTCYSCIEDTISGGSSRSSAPRSSSAAAAILVVDEKEHLVVDSSSITAAATGSNGLFDKNNNNNNGHDHNSHNEKRIKKNLFSSIADDATKMDSSTTCTTCSISSSSSIVVYQPHQPHHQDKNMKDNVCSSSVSSSTSNKNKRKKKLFSADDDEGDDEKEEVIETQRPPSLGGDDDDRDDEKSLTSCTNSDESIISYCSADRGEYDGEVNEWKGCVCGIIHGDDDLKKNMKQQGRREGHESPAGMNEEKNNDKKEQEDEDHGLLVDSLFWIQCDNSRCHTWYNVMPACIGFKEDDAGSYYWNCPDCYCDTTTSSTTASGNSSSNSTILPMFLDLPSEVLYKILEFAEPTNRPYRKPYLLCHCIAPLCKASHQAICNSDRWMGVWELILNRDYNNNKKDSSGSKSHKESAGCNNQQQERRCSKRRRTASTRLAAVVHDTNTPAIEKVAIRHIDLCCRMDEAHIELSTIAEDYSCTPITASSPSSVAPNHLSLPRLRSCLKKHGQPILDLNRRSPDTGRTFLQVCCAADYVNETVILRCVQHILDCRCADPNVFSCGEEPYAADRPVLYFAIARMYPSVVECLIKAGACLNVKVKGRFRYVSDPTRSFEGTFTPHQFACKLYDLETKNNNMRRNNISPPASPIRSSSSSSSSSRRRRTNDSSNGGRRRRTVPSTQERASRQHTSTPKSSPPSSSQPQLPPYWVNKLKQCIRILKSAEQKQATNALEQKVK